MSQFVDSFESEKLKKLISNKEEYLQRLLLDDKNKSSAQILQREIMFLKNEILPIVLNNTCIIHSEFAKRAVRCMDSALKTKCNGLLIYQPINEEYVNNPIIGIANKRANQKFGTYGAIELFIDNMDANSVKVKPINLLIDEL